jgi:hypothetical protein
MDSAVSASYDICRRLHSAPRPDLLLGRAPPPGRHPAGHARALRLRAHGRRDRGRAGARRHGGGAGAPSSTPGRPSSTAAWPPGEFLSIPSSARSWTPAGATGSPLGELHAYMGSMRTRTSTAGSDPDLGGALRSTWGRLGTARWGRIMAPLLLGRGRSAITRDLRAPRAGVSADELPARPARGRRPRPRLYLPQEDRGAPSRVFRRPTWPAHACSGELHGRLVGFERRNGREELFGRRPADTRSWDDAGSARHGRAGWPAPRIQARAGPGRGTDRARAAVRAMRATGCCPAVVAKALHR